MANHRSALKRARQNEVRRLRNKNYKTRARNAVKEVRVAVTDNLPDRARESLAGAVSILQKTTCKGVIHKNKASRTIARLTRQVNRISS